MSNAVDMSSTVGTDHWQLNLEIRKKFETLQRDYSVKRKGNFIWTQERGEIGERIRTLWRIFVKNCHKWP